MRAVGVGCGMLAMLPSMHQRQAIMAVVRLAVVVAAAGVTQELQQPQAHNFTIDATSVTHTVTTRHMGCHLDSGFGEELLALHSNIVFSPSFEFGNPTQKPANTTAHPVGVGWVTVREAAEGTVSMTPDALHGHSALEVQYKGGTGQLGVANRGIGNEGLFLIGQKAYEGYLFARSATGSGASAVLHVALQNFETGATLATQQLTIRAGSNWTRYNLSLTPSADTPCSGIVAPDRNGAATADPATSDPATCGWWKPGTDGDQSAHVCVRCPGQLFVGLATPGAAAVDFVYLEPGEWGRYKGLPVLRPMADALEAMGVKLFRAGGTVAQSQFWQDWRGPLWERTPMVWRNNEVSGFGPFETIDLCNAAGILPILTTEASGRTAKEMADLVEYSWGDESTPWGKVRHDDGHPEVYNVTWFELGNEQQNPNFVLQVKAMEERAVAVGLPKNTLHYLYPCGGGGAGVGGPAHCDKDASRWNVSEVEAINALGLGARIGN